MIWVSIFLMIISQVLWAWHDLYFWGKDWVKIWVIKIGWHNIKMGFKIAYFASAFIAGRLTQGWSWASIGELLFALALIAWGAFEGMYNILERDAKPFDWARYLWSAIINKAFRDMPMDFKQQLKTRNRIEFILNHVFRLHYGEAIIVIFLGGIIITTLH
jgi:hypothetical protein